MNGMKIDFDQIHELQETLVGLPCLSCQHQRLALVLRYDVYKEKCLLSAFCQSCQMKYAIDPVTGCLLDASGIQRSTKSWPGKGGVVVPLSEEHSNQR